MSDWENKKKSSSFTKLLKEDGSFLLKQDEGKIVLEQEISEFNNLEKH